MNQTMMICHSETGPYSLIYRVLSFWMNDAICHTCKQFEYQHQINWILLNFTIFLLAFNLIFLVYLMWRSTHYQRRICVPDCPEFIIIKVQRVFCTHCGRTHALVSVIASLSHHQFSAFQNTLYPLTDRFLYSLVKRFRKISQDAHPLLRIFYLYQHDGDTFFLVYCWRLIKQVIHNILTLSINPV